MSDQTTQLEKHHRARMNPVLFVRFIGENVSPDRVPLSALTRVLEAINLIVGPPDSAKPKKDELPDPGAFQLVSVKRGSAIYGFEGSRDPQSFDAFRNLGRTIMDPGSAFGIDFPLQAIEKLSSIASRMKCRVEISRKEDGDREVLARIEPNSAKSLKHNLLVEGETSIYGEIKRVGGATRMHCSVRLPSQTNLLYCRIANRSLSRKLGKYLYKEVMLHGKAVWLRSTWRIVRFQIQGMAALKDGSITEAFNEIRDAGGSDWESIADPESFLNGEGGME